MAGRSGRLGDGRSPPRWLTPPATAASPWHQGNCHLYIATVFFGKWEFLGDQRSTPLPLPWYGIASGLWFAALWILASYVVERDEALISGTMAFVAYTSAITVQASKRMPQWPADLSFATRRRAAWAVRRGEAAGERCDGSRRRGRRHERSPRSDHVVAGSSGARLPRGHRDRVDRGRVHDRGARSRPPGRSSCWRSWCRRSCESPERCAASATTPPQRSPAPAGTARRPRLSPLRSAP